MRGIKLGRTHTIKQGRVVRIENPRLSVSTKIARRNSKRVKVVRKIAP